MLNIGKWELESWIHKNVVVGSLIPHLFHYFGQLLISKTLFFQFLLKISLKLIKEIPFDCLWVR